MKRSTLIIQLLLAFSILKNRRIIKEDTFSSPKDQKTYHQLTSHQKKSQKVSVLPLILNPIKFSTFTKSMEGNYLVSLTKDNTVLIEISTKTGRVDW